jgi:hypothetical protein
MIKFLFKFASVFSVIALLLVYIGSSTNIAQALSGSEFKSGRIIDDSVFFNSSSLSITEIQNFLNAKVPTCDTNGQQTLYDSAYGDTVTRAVYSSRRGVSTPFTCLKDFHANTSNIAPESGICDGYTGATNESAATIIYRVAQSCGISPRVLLVTLQKEQSLVTDDWPWPTQYQKAMGAFCPDTSPCQSGYAGFFNQVYYGANRFKVYAANPGSFNYRAYRNNTIYYNPGPCQTYSGGSCTKYYGNKYDSNGGSIPDITYCGSTSVYIESQATADLYIYTPYQPNQAALDNLYGTGDICSAYGNRNFWRIFNDWFGSTFAPEYGFSVVSQQYANNTADVIAGNTTQLTLIARNTGLSTWYRDGPNATHMGTANPYDRSSPFYHSSWLGYNRPAAMLEASVAPGQLGSFNFTVKAPVNPGVYLEYFNLVAEGRAWFVPVNMNFYFNVKPRVYTWDITSQSYDNGSSSVIAGDTITLTTKVKNTGNITWQRDGNNPVHLAASNPNGRNSNFANNSWISQSRAAFLQEPSVAPGQIGTFQFSVTAPSNPGTYLEYFNLVSEGSSWFVPTSMNFYLSVQPKIYAWQITGGTYYTDASKTTVARNDDLTPGSKRYVVLQIKNTGNQTLQNTTLNPLHLAASDPDGKNGVLCSQEWLSCSRIAQVNGTTTVAPSQTTSVEFWIKAPSSTGYYGESLNLVSEGLYWLQYNSNNKLWIKVN